MWCCQSLPQSHTLWRNESLLPLFHNVNVTRFLRGYRGRTDVIGPDANVNYHLHPPEEHYWWRDGHDMYICVGHWSLVIWKERSRLSPSIFCVTFIHCSGRYLRCVKSCQRCFINTHRILCCNTFCP